MERIILYYSDGGKTKVVAETLAVNLRCDICQIKDMKKRDGIRNRFTSTIDAFRESKTEIYPPTLDLEEYDNIYVVYSDKVDEITSYSHYKIASILSDTPGEITTYHLLPPQ